MDAMALAGVVAAGRVAVGAAYGLAPERAVPAWIGRDGRRAGPQLLGVAVGARDLAIGAGALAALGGRGDARSWLLAGLLSDGADLLATLRARDRLPALGVVGATVMATTAVAIQARALAAAR